MLKICSTKYTDGNGIELEAVGLQCSNPTADKCIKCVNMHEGKYAKGKYGSPTPSHGHALNRLELLAPNLNPQPTLSRRPGVRPSRLLSRMSDPGHSSAGPRPGSWQCASEETPRGCVVFKFKFKLAGKSESHGRRSARAGLGVIGRLRISINSIENLTQTREEID